MSNTSSPDILARPVRRTRLILLGRGLLLLLAGLGLALGALLAGDAILILSRDLRVAAPWLLGICAVALMAAALWGALHLNAWRLARRAEGRGRETALSNAVALARRDGASPMAEYLRQSALELGRARADSLAVLPLVRRGLLVAGIAAILVTGGWALTVTVAGDVLDAVLPRFLDPDGDHPPWSRVKLTLDLETREVLYGGQCEVRAQTSLPLDDLVLVTVDTTGGHETPMFRRPDRSFVQTLTNLREDTEIWVTDGHTRSLRQRICIRMTPQITAVQYAVRFPGYTRLPEKRRSLTENELRLPVGTEIAFTVSSNRPLRGGMLRLTPLMGGQVIEQELVPVETAGPNAQTVIVVQDAAAVELSVTDVDGLTSAKTRKVRLAIAPDLSPRITVLEPARDALATPEIVVPVVVQADDDYGIAAVQWRRTLNDGPEHDTGMALPDRTDLRQVRCAAAFDFKDLGVRPGDVVTYHFQAVDTDPTGPQTATSRSFHVKIISLEEYQKILREAMAQRSLFDAYQALDQHLQRLAENAEAARDAKAQGTEIPVLASDLKALLASLGDYRKTSRELRQAPEMFDIERSLRAHLTAQDPELAEIQGLLQRATQRAAQGEPPGDLAGLARRLRTLAGGMTTEVGEPARLVTSVARVLALANAFAALANEQDRLARMLQRFKGKSVLDRREQMELQEVAEGIRQVRAGVEQIREQLPDLLAQVPADPAFDALRTTANDFLAAMDQAGIVGDLAVALDRLNLLDATAAHPSAQRAAERMLALCSRCQGMSGQGQKGLLAFQPSLSQSLGNTLGQLASAMANGGSGDGSYGLAGNSVGLYGPSVELAGGPGGRGGDGGARTAAGGTTAQTALPDDAIAAPPQRETSVKPMTDIPFPLLYRQLVGDYYRRVAETAGE